MQSGLAKRTLLGLAVVVLLCVGGLYRWNQVVVGVALENDAGDQAVVCGIRRSDLRGLPHTTSNGYAETTLPIGQWDHDVQVHDPVVWGGTMGTTFGIQIGATLPSSEFALLLDRIDAALKDVNRQMSTWDPASEISRFNQTKSTEAVSVSEAFAEVIQRALEYSRVTEGAFDPTLQPLLNLWGFGSGGTNRTIPSDEAIAKARNLTGWNKVSVAPPARLRKSDPEISLALGAIAKGYGVDAVGRMLNDAGLASWFVEIGGEVLAKGMNPSGEPWKIGIQYPGLESADRTIQGVAHITSGAVATSGDYQNYIEKDGRIYSHILDPRSGRSVLSHTASVTVYASNCTDADAIATALFVMGPEEGIPWVERRPETEALFLIRNDQGEIIEKFSSGFRKATGYTAYGE